MTRLALHRADDILDATRGLVLERGVRSATVDAIAQRSGAPVGSLYHRFGSRDRLMAEMWIRAVRRSQAAFVAAAQHRDAEQGAVDAALSIYHFVQHHRDDARLLVSFRREDLIRTARSPRLLRELSELNQPLEAALTGLARRLFGKANAHAVEQTVFALIDIPMGAIRRHLIAGGELPRALPGLLEVAVRAVLRADRVGAL
ncbi:MAG TPA: helix-turn-helix domain-containing protein [Candidatus Binataceae bacterium]|nr:helix-turn-helix domain-containing protein [Candidatus Binataceae bacterium]